MGIVLDLVEFSRRNPYLMRNVTPRSSMLRGSERVIQGADVLTKLLASEQRWDCENEIRVWFRRKTKYLRSASFVCPTWTLDSEDIRAHAPVIQKGQFARRCPALREAMGRVLITSSGWIKLILPDTTWILKQQFHITNQKANTESYARPKKRLKLAVTVAIGFAGWQSHQFDLLDCWTKLLWKGAHESEIYILMQDRSYWRTLFGLQAKFVHQIRDFEAPVKSSRSVRPSTIFLSASKRCRTCQGCIRDLWNSQKSEYPDKGTQKTAKLLPKTIVITDTTAVFIKSGRRLGEPEELPGTGKKWLDDSFCSAADSWKNAPSVFSENES